MITKSYEFTLTVFEGLFIKFCVKKILKNVFFTGASLIVYASIRGKSSSIEFHISHLILQFHRGSNREGACPSIWADAMESLKRECLPPLCRDHWAFQWSNHGMLLTDHGNDVWDQLCMRLKKLVLGMLCCSDNP